MRNGERTTLLERGSAAALGVAARSLERTIDVLGDARRVTNFLRGRLEFRPRADDVYVVTYPRSGTTWMQYMLHLLTTPGEVDFSHLNEVSPWFERSLSVGFMNAADFERYPGPRIFKSHLPWGWLPRPGRYVYIWRDGRDVAVSYYHFYRSHLGFRGDFDAFFDRFMRGRVQYGSWFKHVAGWQAHADDPSVHVLTYEALSKDREAALRGVADFCGIEADAARLREVLERSTFEAMKAIESKFDHTTAVLLERGMRTRSFIRSGKVGSGDLTLSAGQREAFERAAERPPSTRELNLAAFLH
jgi:hypothetical protein